MCEIHGDSASSTTDDKRPSFSLPKDDNDTYPSLVPASDTSNSTGSVSSVNEADHHMLFSWRQPPLEQDSSFQSLVSFSHVCSNQSTRATITNKGGSCHELCFILLIINHHRRHPTTEPNLMSPAADTQTIVTQKVRFE